MQTVDFHFQDHQGREHIFIAVKAGQSTERIANVNHSVPISSKINWCVLPFHSPGPLPDPGIKPKRETPKEEEPTLTVDTALAVSWMLQKLLSTSEKQHSKVNL